MFSVDEKVFAAVNGLAGRSPIADWIGVIVTSWGLYVMFLLLVALWFRRESVEERQRDRLAIVNAVWAGGLAWVVKYLVSLVYFRPRPFVDLAVNLLTMHEADASFPSGHALFAFGVATSVLLYDRRFGWPLVGFAALIAVSRVYVGVHYPVDVLAGAVLGVIVALLVRRFGFRFDRHVVVLLSRISDRQYRPKAPRS